MNQKNMNRKEKKPGKTNIPALVLKKGTELVGAVNKTHWGREGIYIKMKNCKLLKQSKNKINFNWPPGPVRYGPLNKESV